MKFEPKRVELNEHGASLVAHSANFQQAEQLWMIEPPNENGNATIAIDPEGSVFTVLHESNFTIMEDEIELTDEDLKSFSDPDRGIGPVR